MIGWLGRLLKVERGEWHHVATLGGHFFLVLAAGTALLTVAKALFVGTYPRAWLPWGYLGGAAAGLAASWAYGRMARRLAARRLTAVVGLVLAAVLAALWFASVLAPETAPFALLLLAPGFNVLFGVENAGLVARTLDPRSARRLYAAVGSIGGIGATAGAFAAGRLGELVGVGNVLWLCAGLVVLSLAPALAVKADRRSERPRRPGPWSAVLKQPLPVVLMVLVVAAAVLNNLANYQLDCAAKDALGDPVRLNAFYGNVNALLNAISILLPFLLARPLIARLGVGLSFAVYPGLLLAAGIGGLAVPVLPVFAAGMVAERLFRQNLQRPLLNIATLPMSEAIRDRTALALRGTLESPATAVTAIALLVTAGAVPWRALSWAVVVVAVLALAAAAVARRGYITELVASLHARRLRLDAVAGGPDALDHTLRELLRRQLASENPASVALALELLRGQVDEDLCDQIRRRCEDWEPWVREAAVRTLGESRSPQAAELLREMANGADAAVAAAAIRALGADAGPMVVERALASDLPAVRAEGMVSAFGAGREDEVRTAVGGWAQDADPTWRRMAVRVAARTEDPDLEPVLRALAEEAPEEALSAGEGRPWPELAELAVGCLTVPELAPRAVQVLTGIGDGALPALSRAAARATTAAAAMAVIASLGTARARRLLVDLLCSEDELVRLRAARSLAAVSSADASPAPGEKDALAAAAGRELEIWRGLDAERLVVAEGPLTADLDAEVAVASERTLLVLAVLHRDPSLRRVALSAAIREPGEFQFAVEALDEALDPPWRRAVLELLERGGDRDRREPADPWRERVRRGVSSPGSDPLVDAARELQAAAPFAGWRLRDLAPVAAASWAAGDGRGGRPEGVVLRVAQGEVPGIRELLLGRDIGAGVPGERVVPLAEVWRATATTPAASAAWLAGVADLLTPEVPAAADLSRSRTASLASRTAGDDHELAGDDLEAWRRVFFLRTAPLFEGLGAARLRLVAAIARSLHAAAGETVVRQGGRGRHFYLVCSGRVEVEVDGSRVAELGPADAFGAHALLTGRVRSATVRALEPCDLLGIDRADFLDLLDTHPRLVPAFSVLLARQSSPPG